MPRGIVGTIQLAVTLAFAIPLGIFGVDYLLDGRLLVGGIALGVAVLMVVLEEYLTTPGDIPERVAETAAAVAVGGDPDEGQAGLADAEDASEPKRDD